MNRTHLTGLMLLTLALMLALCLKLTHGQFFYTLDDPYIHLTLAQHVFAGEYGLNDGVFAAPSSSLLWPFLLVPFMGFSWAAWVPLGINTLCLLGTGHVMYRVLARTWPKAAALATYVLLLATNAFGLVFTGMEHSLQVLLAVLIVAGLMDVRDRVAPRGLMLALIVAPLVRYEMVGVSALAIGLLMLWGHTRYVWAGVIFTVILSAFSFFLWRSSGQFLPASVMGKITFYVSPLGNQLMLGLLVVCTASFVWVLRGEPASRQLLLWATAIAVVQLCLGKNGWFNRYEVYVLVVVATVLMDACARHNARILQHPVATSLCFFTAVLAMYWYGATTLHTPAASRCIRLQQGEMRRLADIAGNPPVAINDIGYIGFRNPAPVFDLVGLGNWQAQRMLRRDPEKLLGQVSAQNIPLIMLYPQWFARLPSAWVKLGTLQQAGAHAKGCAIAGENVEIYASDAKWVVPLSDAIDLWSATLPEGDTWVPAAAQ